MKTVRPILELTQIARVKNCITKKWLISVQTISFSVFFLFILQPLHAQFKLDLGALDYIRIFNEANINTPEIEFAPTFLNDRLVFVHSDINHKKDKLTGEYFFDLGFALPGKDKALAKQASFGSQINTRLHEGPATYDNENDILYVSRTVQPSLKKAANDSSSLKIYAFPDPLNNQNGAPINLCSENYSIGHPTVFDKGNAMLLISNRAGGKGGMDLYESGKSGNDWSELEALDSVNTEFQELFPFVYQDSFLFFSSNRPGGFGGLDIYLSKRIQRKWSKPVLLQGPLNTEFDDFGFTLNQNADLGYLTSNRTGGKGKDDIYRIEFITPIILDVSTIEKDLLVIDKLTLQPISSAKAILIPLDLDLPDNTSNYSINLVSEQKGDEVVLKFTPDTSQMTSPIFTNQKGEANLQLVKSKQYLMKVEAAGFEVSNLVLSGKNTEHQITVVMDPIPPEEEPKPLEILDKVIEKGSIITLKDIYYDRNSARIKEESTFELDALVDLMLKNPSIEINLIAHTDSRGDFSHNQILSADRARAAMNYLTTRGVLPDRIIPMGKGESQILNHCTEGVPCSDAEHLVNRRTEVQIRKM